MIGESKNLENQQEENHSTLVADNGIGSPSINETKLDSLEWKRLSPLTPVLNNFSALGALLVFLLIREYDLLLLWWQQKNKFSLTLLFSVFGFIGSILLAVLLYSLWSWYWSGYHLGDTHFYFRKGKIFKDRRQVPLDRVQGVQQSQPLLAQITRLYKVHIESAGGKDSHVDVAYVGAREADYLVSEISRRSHIQRGEMAANDDAVRAPSSLDDSSLSDTTISTVLAETGTQTMKNYGSGQTVSPNYLETQLLQIKNSNLILANLLDTGKLFLIIIYIFSLGIGAIFAIISGKNPFTFSYWQDNVGFYVIIVFTITVLGSILSPLFKNFNTRTWSAEKGIKSSRGLTTLTRSYLPYDRIHGFTFRQSLLWRLFGWWKGNLIAAGRSHSSDEKKPDADEVIPVGSEQDLHNILDIIMPDLENAVKSEILKEIIYSDLKFPGWLRIKSGTRWLSPFDGAVEGIKYTDTVLARKWGLLDKRGVITPLSHVQNVTIKQGPLARALGVATITAYLVQNAKQPFVRMSLLPLEQAVPVFQDLNRLVLVNMKPLKESLKESF